MRQGEEDPLLMDLIHAVASSNQTLVEKLLTEHPDLIRTGLRSNAKRAEVNTYFFDEIQHQLYIGDTALHAAAAGLNGNIATALIKRGAAVDAKNRLGAEPLHYACDAGPMKEIWNPQAQAKVIKLLLANGADPNATDKNQVTSLHRAVRTRSAIAVRTLVEGGADVRRRNANGSTPLHLAVQNTGRGGSGLPAAKVEQVAIIEFLWLNGASPDDCDNQGRTVRQWISDESIKALFE
ncbi:MAG: ankyrin repeat domain-containing protein [Cyanobacteria bacterium SZAS TMP-1]|nr:ankyrin repeat domain-containing protein [Cyanobacteria bacterium SZAS TMP-1]